MSNDALGEELGGEHPALNADAHSHEDDLREMGDDAVTLSEDDGGEEGDQADTGRMSDTARMRAATRHRETGLRLLRRQKIGLAMPVKLRIANVPIANQVKQYAGIADVAISKLAAVGHVYLEKEQADNLLAQFEDLISAYCDTVHKMELTTASLLDDAKVKLDDDWLDPQASVFALKEDVSAASPMGLKLMRAMATSDQLVSDLTKLVWNGEATMDQVHNAVYELKQALRPIGVLGAGANQGLLRAINHQGKKPSATAA